MTHEAKEALSKALSDMDKRSWVLLTTELLALLVKKHVLMKADCVRMLPEFLCVCLSESTGAAQARGVFGDRSAQAGRTLGQVVPFFSPCR